jgi:predicted nucleic acid-binding protein
MVRIAAVLDCACLIGLERIGQRLIPSIRPLMDALDQHQFRISSALRAEALRLAGE